MAPDVRLFHDSPTETGTLLQCGNPKGADLPPFSLQMDLAGFRGSYLSLAIELPEAACDGLTRSHLIWCKLAIEADHSPSVFVRLNIRHGPNIASFLRHIDVDKCDNGIDFDLINADLNEQRVGGAWLDLIVEAPTPKRLTLRDLALARHRRARI